MQAHHHREDMGPDDLRSAMTLTGHNPCLDPALLFDRDHIPLGHGHGPRYHVAGVRKQSHGTTDAAAQVTAATAAEAAAPSAVGATAIES